MSLATVVVGTDAGVRLLRVRRGTRVRSVSPPGQEIEKSSFGTHGMEAYDESGCLATAVAVSATPYVAVRRRRA